MPAHLIDLTDQVFGRLTVLRRNGSRRGRPAWLCRCACGSLKTIAGVHLRDGETRSCGCLARELTKARWRSPEAREVRQKMSEAAKRRRRDPRAGRKAALTWKRHFRHDPEFRKAARTRARSAGARRDLAAHAEAMRQKWQEPTHRRKVLKVLRSPPHRSRARKLTEQLWRDPDWRAKQEAGWRISAEGRHSLGEAHRKLWQDPEYRARVLAARKGKRRKRIRAKFSHRPDLTNSPTRSPEKVADILERRRRGQTTTKIAAVYGCSSGLIWNICAKYGMPRGRAGPR